MTKPLRLNFYKFLKGNINDEKKLRGKKKFRLIFKGQFFICLLAIYDRFFFFFSFFSANHLLIVVSIKA